LDGFRQVIAKQCVECNMSAATFEANIVEQLAQGFCIAPMVSRKFDSFVAHLADGFDGANQILGAFVANGIELEAERNFLSAIIFLCQQKCRTAHCGHGGGGNGSQKVSSRNCSGFHALAISAREPRVKSEDAWLW